MAFLRVEQKKSGAYMRIIESYKENGISKHRTLYSLGKVEDYSPGQLEKIATKLLELAGCNLEDIIGDDIQELARLNYGYALMIKKLWKILDLNSWMKRVNNSHRIQFDWLSCLELMIAERLNSPCSKHASFHNQHEYLGFSSKQIDLQHFYRTLDLMSDEQESLKKHLFNAQSNLFTNSLDVVFYDVTTLYFDSQVVEESTLRQKGYSKDGKAHKTQIVLGLLVDKMRNPITYHIYKGNTYEGKTMIDALEDLQQKYKIDKVVAVADSAMIDASNRQYMESSKKISYIIGDRIKNLPSEISKQLIDPKNHKDLSSNEGRFTFCEINHNGRRIICTYSEKRSKKDKHEREKLIEKAKLLLANPSQLKQAKKRGAGRFIKQQGEEVYTIDIKKIEQDAKWDGYKAIATTTELEPSDVLNKYADLFEVEHAFRSLKSQLKVRPIFHWTDKRIEGHIAMCFIAYTFLNHLRLNTKLSEKEIIKALDGMQMSKVQQKKAEQVIFLKSKTNTNQTNLLKSLKIEEPKDTTSELVINQYFT